MKNLIISQLLTLCAILFSFNLIYAQTTYGTGAGTQGDNTNSYYGNHSGANNTETGNSFFGSQSGRYNILGERNSFFGPYSGLRNVDGYRNSFFGFNAGQNNDTGSNNTYTGSQSGQYGTIGENNSFFGTRSGFRSVDGSYNTFIGMYAGENNSIADHNSFIGYMSGRFNTSGENNSFFGVESGYLNDTGSNNTFLGFKSGRSATGSGNVFLGYSAGFYETGDNKLYIANSSTDTPLIHGDFTTSQLTFNGEIGIASSTGKSIIKNVQHHHDGVPETFLSLTASENSDSSVLISETGRIAVGTVGDCMRHTTTNDNTFLIVDGAALKYGDAFWESASDQNLKKNINPLQKSLDKFLGINFYDYQYKKTNQTRYGIMAQEMEDIFPHSMGKLIEEDGTEYLTFNPNNLFYTGLKATQEIGEMALAQEIKIEELEKENASLKSEIEAIKEALKNNGIEIAQDDDSRSYKEEVPHLLQNKPNPFGETTNIPYFLTKNIEKALILIYDANGKVVEKHKLPVKQGAANLELSLMKNKVSKGVYSYSLIVDGNLVDTKKMLVQ